MVESRFLSLSQLGQFYATETGFVAHYGTEKVAIDVVKADLLRVRISRGGEFDATPTFALAVEPIGAARAAGYDTHFEVVIGQEQVELVTSHLVAQIQLEQFGLFITRTDGSVVLDARSEQGNSYYRHLNGSFISQRKAAMADNIFGLGEKTGRQNRRGRDFTLWNVDVLNPTASGEFTSALDSQDPRANNTSVDFDPYYVSIPFFYHQDAATGKVSASFVDNSYRSTYDFSQPNQLSFRFEGGQLSEYIFGGPDISEILRDYTWLTGRMELPPIWALGYHQCRWHGYNHDSLIALAKKHRDLGIPLDVLWLDIDHMDGYRVFTWNKELFPDIRQTLKQLGEMGIRVITIIDPGVKAEAGYAVYDSGKANDVFCITEGGDEYIGQVWPGNTAFPDFVKPEARSWWGALNAQHVQSGLAGIWNDMNEPATGEIAAERMRFGGGKYSHERYHNTYALLMAMGTVEGLKEAIPNLRTFVLSRAGSPGIQRYAANWMGDNMSRWDHLWLSTPMGNGLGLSGQAFVGADIGGFGEDSNPELFARWIQHGALSPFARNHNMVNQIDQYAFSFGDQVLEVAREAIALRYKLMPYIYSQFALAAETGAPVQRSLVFDYQYEKAVANLDDQYLFGQSLLVAPVYAAGAVAREVYFPTGEWLDWHTGQSVVSAQGSTLQVAAPLQRIPLFVKAGAVIPTWPGNPQTTMGYQPQELELQVWVPGQDAVVESVLHEDDGLTLDSSDSKYLKTLIRLERTGSQLSISGTVVGQGYPEFVRTSLRLTFKGQNAANLAPVVLTNDGQDFEIQVELEA